MSSASKLATLIALLSVALSCSAAPALRVCADPNNLPYSNKERQGFENRLAQMIASDLGVGVSYFWFPQQDAFFRKTLDRHVCDIVMSVPRGFPGADVTRAYYRSSYAFVSRRADRLQINSFDDSRLKSLRIGVHLLGSGDDSLPPVHALASRGIVHNVVGYSIFGHSITQPDPTADLVEAVARHEVDVAIVWGPTAGYFARKSAVPLALEPITSDPKNPNLPFTFSIGVGVRKGDAALQRELDEELLRRRADIVRLLRSYGIPQMSLAATPRSVAEN